MRELRATIQEHQDGVPTVGSEHQRPIGQPAPHSDHHLPCSIGHLLLPLTVVDSVAFRRAVPTHVQPKESGQTA
jgi:hypothetical protein